MKRGAEARLTPKQGGVRKTRQALAWGLRDGAHGPSCLHVLSGIPYRHPSFLPQAKDSGAGIPTLALVCNCLHSPCPSALPPAVTMPCVSQDGLATLNK